MFGSFAIPQGSARERNALGQPARRLPFRLPLLAVEKELHGGASHTARLAFMNMCTLRKTSHHIAPKITLLRNPPPSNNEQQTNRRDHFGECTVEELLWVF